MKYWRGYLVAGVLAFFTWGLMQFAQAHGQVLDLVYPFLTRSVQDSLAAWSGQVDVCLWQLLLVLLGVACVASIVLMIILRWNPIQWFGWVLAVASLIFFLHTGIGGLNTYTGALADDLHLSVSEYTLQELKDATIYYRDHANTLAAQVAREGNSVSFPDFDTLAAQAGEGFQRLTYEDYYAVFAGSTAPVKKLGWAEMYTSMGITGVTMPLTGEAAVNPTVPAVSIPFTMCHEMAHRMSITLERDANFAAFLAKNAAKLASRSRVMLIRWAISWHMVKGMLTAGTVGFTAASPVRGMVTPVMPMEVYISAQPSFFTGAVEPAKTA